MKKKVILIEGRNGEGKLILSLELSEDEVTVRDVHEISASKEDETKEEKDQEEVLQNDDPMTDAQKRYLFRILAGRGKEGDAAYEKLKELFQAESLKEVTKAEASRMIERLLEERKGEKDD